MSMKVSLSLIEARIIGALIEKEITTPDQYPLSLNALVNACNQKTNRDPVMNLDEQTVQVALDGLSKRHLVLERSGFGSRVVKYRHRLCNGDHNPLKLTEQEVAVLTELMLRGPQTPGELRSRAQRLGSFTDIGDVEITLELLATRDDGPYVVKLPKAPGSRESRFCQLLTGEPDLNAFAQSAAQSSTHGTSSVESGMGLADRIEALERQVAELTARLDSIAPSTTES
jgi:uncharacterized protein YceH (UPF0502 family)